MPVEAATITNSTANPATLADPSAKATHAHCDVASNFLTFIGETVQFGFSTEDPGSSDHFSDASRAP